MVKEFAHQSEGEGFKSSYLESTGLLGSYGSINGITFLRRR